MAEFFDMGGYAEFVWPAYALVLGGLIGLLICSRRNLQRSQSEVAALEAASPRRRNRTPSEEATDT